MSHPETRLPAAAAMAVLAMVGLGAQAADLRGESYAMIDPAAAQRATPASPAPAARAPAAKAGKKIAKPGKAKILTGMQSYRTPAQRALERINRPAAFHDGAAKSQAWRYANASADVARLATDRPTGEPAGLEHTFPEIPVFVPDRESVYKFTLSLPVGRYERVQLQADLRRNAFNTEDGKDSTLRADWSMRF